MKYRLATLFALVVFAFAIIASPALAAGPALLTLEIEPAAMIGSNSATGTITLDGAAPVGGAVISLVSSLPDVLQVPASVTIVEGATQGSFEINSVLVEEYVNGTVAATYAGATIEMPFSVSPIWVEYAQVYPERIAGGALAEFSVFMTGASGKDIPVSLSSDNPAVAPVAGTGTVSAGNEWASFQVKTSEVTTATRVTLSATYRDDTVSAELLVLPAASVELWGLGLEEPGVLGGDESIAWAMLDAGAPVGGAIVSLASSRPDIAQVPESVTVPEGATEASFTISTSPVANFTDVVLTATWHDSVETADFIVMSPIEDFELTPENINGGKEATGAVTLSEAAPEGGAVVTLSSSNPKIASVPATVHVPAGQKQVSFSVSTTMVSERTRVTITGNWRGKAKTATLRVGPSMRDDVALGAALYFRQSRQLGISATSTSSFAKLKVFNKATGQVIGKLENKGKGVYSGQFLMPEPPERVIVKSSLGGLATKRVTIK